MGSSPAARAMGARRGTILDPPECAGSHRPPRYFSVQGERLPLHAAYSVRGTTSDMTEQSNKPDSINAQSSARGEAAAVRDANSAQTPPESRAAPPEAQKTPW